MVICKTHCCFKISNLALWALNWSSFSPGTISRHPLSHLKLILQGSKLT